MSASAITMMIIGVVIIWGGFGMSVAHAISKSKENRK